MADFAHAFMLTEQFEGEYSHDPNDRGGETYKGISRRYHPDWEGWPIVDGYDKSDRVEFEMALQRNDELQDMVEAFYKANYWDAFQGDAITNQALADELFDTAVNLGVSRTVRFLQEALNALNRNASLYDDLVPDGLMGPVTQQALKAYLGKDDPFLLVKIINVFQGMHYIEIMRADSTQERFARGWFKRVDIIKR